MKRILVTGSSGLIGTAVCRELERLDWMVERLDVSEDLASGAYGDVRDRVALERKVATCTGVLHLAAVSRVVWGEQNPILCEETNVGGTRNVIEAAATTSTRPWVLFSSSREVYGEPRTFPVHEDHDLSDLNVYGSSKIAGEKLVVDGREHGLNTAVMRLSNVYGTTSDHADRVVTAFSRAGAVGDAMRVDGRSHVFDFTHLDDTVRGIIRLIALLDSGERNLPPVHFVTGKPTTLGALAEIARGAGGSHSDIYEAPERNYDVTKFVGDPSRAAELLGWKAEVDISEGVRRLVRDFQNELVVC